MEVLPRDCLVEFDLGSGNVSDGKQVRTPTVCSIKSLSVANQIDGTEKLKLQRDDNGILQCVHLNRYSLLAVYVCINIICGAPYNNWSAMSLLFANNHIYLWKCSKEEIAMNLSGESGIGCSAQDTSIASLYSIAYASELIMAYPAGVLYDILGMKMSLLFLQGLCCLGWFLASLSNQDFQSAPAACVCWGAVNSVLVTSTISVAYLFPRKFSTVAVLLGISAQVGLFKPVIFYYIVHPEGTPITFFRLVCIFCPVCVGFSMVVTAFVAPWKMYGWNETEGCVSEVDSAVWAATISDTAENGRRGEEGEVGEGPNSGREELETGKSITLCKTNVDATILLNTNSDTTANSINNIDITLPEKPEGANVIRVCLKRSRQLVRRFLNSERCKRFVISIRKPQFFLYCIALTGIPIAQSYFQQAAPHRMLPAVAVAVLKFFIPVAGVFTILLGLIADRLGIIVCIAVFLCVGIFSMFFAGISNIWVYRGIVNTASHVTGIIAAFLYCIFASFMKSSTRCYVIHNEKSFDRRDFGALTGVIFAWASLFAIIGGVLYADVTVSLLGGYCSPVAFSIGIYLFLCLLVFYHIHMLNNR